MGNGTERISGQLNETEAPVADGVWNDTGEEPDVAAQDAEDLREVTADAADSGKRADVFFAEVLESTRSHVRILLDEGRVSKGGKTLKPNYRIKAGEMFQITHDAYDWRCYAIGACDAALFLGKKLEAEETGLYTMSDLL